MNIIRIGSNLTVILQDGTTLTSTNCSDDLFNQVFANQNDENAVKNLLSPKLVEKVEEYNLKKELIENLSSSRYLTVSGSSVYLKDISELTLPEDFITAFFKAEKANNLTLLESYLNFWTLASLNPDSRARMNLFWFLSKYGMTITKKGLFVAYRNVEVKSQGTNIDKTLSEFISVNYAKVKSWKKSPANFIVVNSSVTGYYITKRENADSLEETETVLGLLSDKYKNLSEDGETATVYTDNYTKTFNIKIGEVVSVPRKNCDSKQENICSRGLHVASKSWLESNGSGFGGTSLAVLVNPVDVVAVPPKDSYGKMRVCAYYPVHVVERKDGKIVDTVIDNGFEDDFIDKIVYTGEINNEDSGMYQIEVPSIPEIDKSIILNRLSKMKRNKYVN